LFDPDYYPTPTGDGEIIIYYKKVMAPESNTIGIENHAQNVGLQYVYNNAFDPTANGISNEFAIKFTTEPPFASIITSVEGNQDSNGNLTENGFVLEQNRPNPFNSHTWINYSLPEPCNVSLDIFNISGGLVRTLFTGRQPAGKYSVEWDGLTNAGNPVSSGIYFYRLQTEGFSGSRKMYILR
jgi:hypothetical protein